jgi:hypothetical protein
MNKLIKFKVTKNGILATFENDGEFISINEMIGVLDELINGKSRVLENYADVDEESAEWQKKAKAVLIGEIATLESVKKYLY